jgi:hypothetical protein
MGRERIPKYPHEFTSQSTGIDPVSSNSGIRFCLVKTTPHESNPSLVHAKIKQSCEAESISGKWRGRLVTLLKHEIT